MRIKLIWFLLIYILVGTNIVYSSIENKILLKINEQIITTQDITNNMKYLGILNKDFLKLEEEQMFEISKNSLINQKIKKMEISKRFPDVQIKQNFLDEILLTTIKNLGYESIEEFKIYLKKQSLNLKFFEENLVTNSLWNEFISFKFESKINIDEDRLKLELEKKQSKKRYSYLLSEIVFSAETKKLNNLINDINSSIVLDGFENAALKYSISNSANLGGKIGWIQEDSLSKLIIEEIKKLKEGEHTKPINIPSGFLILKLNKLKKENIEIDFKKELEKLKKQKVTNQYKQFSNIYFNKIKKEYVINEL